MDADQLARLAVQDAFTDLGKLCNALTIVLDQAAAGNPVAVSMCRTLTEQLGRARAAGSGVLVTNGSLPEQS